MGESVPILNLKLYIASLTRLVSKKIALSERKAVKSFESIFQSDSVTWVGRQTRFFPMDSRILVDILVLLLVCVNVVFSNCTE